jgi:hypothetical protein
MAQVTTPMDTRLPVYTATILITPMLARLMATMDLTGLLAACSLGLGRGFMAFTGIPTGVVAGIGAAAVIGEVTQVGAATATGAATALGVATAGFKAVTDSEAAMAFKVEAGFTEVEADSTVEVEAGFTEVEAADSVAAVEAAFTAAEAADSTAVEVMAAATDN